MLQNRSLLRIVDNTDVLEIRCFQPRNKFGLGDLVTGSVTKISTTGEKAHKRGDVVRAVIVSCRGKVHQRNTGIRMSSNMNAGVLVNHAGKEGWVPVGTRVSHAVPRILRQKGWSNIISISTNLV